MFQKEGNVDTKITAFFTQFQKKPLYNESVDLFGVTQSLITAIVAVLTFGTMRIGEHKPQP